MRRLIALLFVVGLFAALPVIAAAGGNPPPPNCESGQLNATINTSVNGADDPNKHFGRYLGCL